MEIIKVENLSFKYPLRERMALQNVNLTFSRGEFVTVCGKTGCGKTTLLRLLKPSIAPSGNKSGKIFFEGKPLSECGRREEAARIGFVMQNPDNQIVTDKVWHELAFGLESLGYSTNEIRIRVSEMASFFGIESWFHKKITELSGGQKQILNLASVMAMNPSVLILDEPTSQLDPIAAGEFIGILHKISRETGVTVIISEHRLEDVLYVSDRVVVMDDGKIISSIAPSETGEILRTLNHDMYEAMPVPMRVWGGVKNEFQCPVSVRDGRIWLEKYAEKYDVAENLVCKKKRCLSDETVLEMDDVWFRYEKNLPDILKGISLKVKKGELFAILGGNGAGKTTALSVMSGINNPYRGKIFINGENISKTNNLRNGIIGVLPQDPQTLFVKKTVFLDLMEILSEEKLEKDEAEKRVKEVSSLCRIEDLLSFHPYDLSGGQQQRAALAKILLLRPQILLLDEPTKGMDAHFKAVFADIISTIVKSGKTIVMVSHDVEFCAENADRCALVFDGSITSLGEPEEIFSGNSFYTTSANRMARTIIPNVILAEDIILSCGGTVIKKEVKNDNERISDYSQKELSSDIKIQNKNMPHKISPLTAIFILLIIPLTIFWGTHFLGGRKYYFISLLIIFEIMIPFLMTFEKRKPKAREIVIISVICAIAVIGRAAFFMLPQFKPVAAIVIIAGVCFGGEAGFLVGAVSGFVSNFFFGQGPWTPFQMFAFGIIGFVSGIIFKSGMVKKTRLSLSILGAAMVIVFYGGIMNPLSVILGQENINIQMILSVYALGLPFDLIHAASTAFFLWFISEPMIEKIERIKLKYGLIAVEPE